jgi:hypothetical protein
MPLLPRPSHALLALATVVVVACSSPKTESTPASNRPAIEPVDWNADCDPIVPWHCGFPFPSDHYAVDDQTSPTGKRLALKPGHLPKWRGKETDPAPFNKHDGWSPTGHLLAMLPYASTTGLPSVDDIGLSLTKDSPTIVLDTKTGQFVPHFTELDVSQTFEVRFDDYLHTFIIRPVVRLKDSTRYIVAVRKVVDDEGRLVPPSPAFTALRDGTPSTEPSVEARRGKYQEIFAKLEAAGIPKGDLQLAWDFTTASKDFITRDLLHMRDDGLAAVGEEGPSYVIKKVEENPEPEKGWLRKRITATMTLPLYTERKEAPTQLVRGEDGKPKQNGTAEFDVLILVPKAAETQPCPLLQNGHGLLGSKSEGDDGYLAEMAQKGCFVAFSVDLVGMAGDDRDSVSAQIIGDIGEFRKTVERQHQGILNSLLAMRMMKGRFVKEPEIQFNGHSAIDPTRRYYRGDSQGGIFGATYMALTTDVERGVLGEPGAPYSLLLNRSVDFAPFFFLLKGVYPYSPDLQRVLALVQLFWDHTEPGGYIDSINKELFPNTPKHEVLIHVAIGDHQVTPLGAHIMARSVSAKSIAPANRPIWGVDEVAAPLTGGSAIVEWEFGTPEAPKTNVPNSAGADPHDLVRELDAAQAQERDFFLEGVVKQYCKEKCDPE